MECAISDVDATRCLAQADALLWLAQCLRRPDIGFTPSGVELEELARAAGMAKDPTALAALRALARHLETEPAAEHTIEHHRLFDGAMACPPNEAAYVRRDKGAILGDVCGFYRAFGFTPRDGTGDRPDHVAAELEFVAMLLVMLAQAAQADQPEAVEVTQNALRDFSHEHVDAWLSVFARQLGDVAASDFHAALAEALMASWEALVQDHAIPRSAQVPVGEPMSEPEDISACGLADAAAAPGAVELRVSATTGDEEQTSTGCIRPTDQ